MRKMRDTPLRCGSGIHKPDVPPVGSEQEETESPANPAHHCRGCVSLIGLC
jgi:hypothetical protein